MSLEKNDTKKEISPIKAINPALPGLLAGIALYGIVCQVGVFFVTDKISYSIGLWIGVLIAGFMAFHMALSLNTAVDMDEKGAQAAATRHNIIRYVVVVVVFAILMVTRLGNPLAAFLGVMGLKISAYLQPLINRVSKTKEDTLKQEKIE